MDSIVLADVAEFLRRKGSHRRVLFLGSKAGIFFDNEILYDLVKGYSTETFGALNSVQKFQRCYRILELERFSELERDLLLRRSLNISHNHRREDDYLAHLIRANFFDVIIP